MAGKKIPDDFTVDVIESKPGVVATFVLPNYYGDKLGKEELAAIAGGRTWHNAFTVIEGVTTEAVAGETTALVAGEVAGGAVIIAVLI
jgi:hypothetical protein